MKILLCKWGLLKFDPILNFYVNWESVVYLINTTQYIVSIWLFKNLPKIFKDSYVIAASGGVTSKNIRKIIETFEEKEGIQLSQDKKDQIIEAAVQIQDKKKSHHELELK